jgi:predicted transcriptional regulator
MHLPSTHEPHVGLAVDVFRTQTPALVLSLKDFLTVLPNHQCVQAVLTEAIYQLAETDLEAFRWLLRNSTYLEPEIDLSEVAINLALTKLENQGFVQGQDFRIEANSRLYVNEQTKAQLMLEDSAYDSTFNKQRATLFILEEILQVVN